MIVAIVDELAPALVARNSIGHGSAAQLLVTAGENAERLQSEPASPRYVARARYRLPPEKRPAIASTEAAIGRPTVRSTSSPSDGFGPIPGPRPTSRNVLPKATPSSKPSDA